MGFARWRLGWPRTKVPVFPCVPGGKTPATRHGFKDATTDPAIVAAWWATTRYNLGLPTGPAGLIVIDLDVPKPGKALPEEWACVSGVVDGADVLAVLADRARQPYPFSTRTITTRPVDSICTSPTPGPRSRRFRAVRAASVRSSTSERTAGTS